MILNKEYLNFKFFIGKTSSPQFNFLLKYMNSNQSKTKNIVLINNTYEPSPSNHTEEHSINNQISNLDSIRKNHNPNLSDDAHS